MKIVLFFIIVDLSNLDINLEDYFKLSFCDAGNLDANLMVTLCIFFIMTNVGDSFKKLDISYYDYYW